MRTDGKWFAVRWLVAVGVAVASVGFVPAADPAPTETAADRVGRIVRVPLPIKTPVRDRVSNAILRLVDEAHAKKQRLTLILEFQLQPNQTEFARGSDFDSSLGLAHLLLRDALRDVHTVAYVPNPNPPDRPPACLEGHAVLVALACDELVMAATAEIGAAGIAEPNIDKTMLAAYREIASARRSVPAEIALRMLDRNLDVLEVATAKDPRLFVLTQDLPELEKTQLIKSRRDLAPRGEWARFSGKQGNLLGFVRQTAADRREVLEELGLPRNSVEEDVGGQWRPAQVMLHGRMRAEMVNQIENMIDREIRENNVNFVCLWIDSPGGSLADSQRLADYLAGLHQVRTVAYVPKRALADASLVATACDQVVMHESARLGGDGARVLESPDIRAAGPAVRQRLVREGRCWSLPLAMIDPSLEVFQYSRLGVTEYFCEEEWRDLTSRSKWQQGPAITRPGQPLTLDGQTALSYRVASFLVRDFRELKEHYGLEGDPRLLEPSWAHTLVEALGHPGAAALLLIIAFVGLYFELHIPGMGVGAFVSVVCFALFFWSRFLGGTAGWLEVLLFLLGIGCLALEVFVIPGFGIFGLGGGALILASLILASQTFGVFPRNSYQLAEFEQSVWMVAGAVLGSILVVVFLRRWLPHAPLLNRMLLAPPSGAEAAAIAHQETLLEADDLLGVRGVTTTPLMPGGKARFGQRVFDVSAAGEALARGVDVVVVDVQGNRIMVERVKE